MVRQTHEAKNVQVTINGRTPAPDDDELGRELIGWTEGMSVLECWEAGRGVWKMRAERALLAKELEVINWHGTVVAIGTNLYVRAGRDGRVMFTGTVDENDPRIGEPARHRTESRNPVAYF
ncbi:hypothetical protein MB46_18620 [Arthrobacter alpinus]|uniref:hypothetical protein n=1 Tax=Arthrobacter alpinus TaxID=656366 RepID=UPI000678E9AA|nr:hypothetical protein [Arthrobacter alpinus]ALV47206.1 hypothetical protein MB46_18620 [Arthrobacter alpinus]